MLRLAVAPVEDMFYHIIGHCLAWVDTCVVHLCATTKYELQENVIVARVFLDIVDMNIWCIDCLALLVNI